jgi:hypothetical protein
MTISLTYPCWPFEGLSIGLWMAPNGPFLHELWPIEQSANSPPQIPHIVSEVWTTHRYRLIYCGDDQLHYLSVLWWHLQHKTHQNRLKVFGEREWKKIQRSPRNMRNMPSLHIHEDDIGGSSSQKRPRESSEENNRFLSQRQGGVRIAFNQSLKS